MDHPQQEKSRPLHATPPPASAAATRVQEFEEAGSASSSTPSHDHTVVVDDYPDPNDTMQNNAEGAGNASPSEQEMPGRYIISLAIVVDVCQLQTNHIAY